MHAGCRGFTAAGIWFTSLPLYGTPASPPLVESCHPAAASGDPLPPPSPMPATSHVPVCYESIMFPVMYIGSLLLPCSYLHHSPQTECPSPQTQTRPPLPSWPLPCSSAPSASKRGGGGRSRKRRGADLSDTDGGAGGSSGGEDDETAYMTNRQAGVCACACVLHMQGGGLLPVWAYPSGLAVRLLTCVWAGHMPAPHHIPTFLRTTSRPTGLCRWSAVSRTERYKKRLAAEGEDTSAVGECW